jgi:hypothetical protein
MVHPRRLTTTIPLKDMDIDKPRRRRRRRPWPKPEWIEPRRPVLPPPHRPIMESGYEAPEGVGRARGTLPRLRRDQSRRTAAAVAVAAAPSNHPDIAVRPVDLAASGGVRWGRVRRAQPPSSSFVPSRMYVSAHARVERRQQPWKVALFRRDTRGMDARMEIRAALRLLPRDGGEVELTARRERWAVDAGHIVFSSFGRRPYIFVPRRQCGRGARDDGTRKCGCGDIAAWEAGTGRGMEGRRAEDGGDDGLSPPPPLTMFIVGWGI